MIRPLAIDLKVVLIPILLLVLMFTLVLAAPKSFSQDVPYYRYINEKGVKVISTQIPSRYVKRGYDIITVDGRLIERVAPEPTGAEKEKLLKQQKEQKRLKEWDAELLKRYSHPADIESAKQRKLAQNMNSIGILKRNVEKIDQEINRYQSIAASDEREGRDVSADTLESIERLKRERSVELNEVAEREKERTQIVESYDKDIERFKVIRPNLPLTQ